MEPHQSIFRFACNFNLVENLSIDSWLYSEENCQFFRLWFNSSQFSNQLFLCTLLISLYYLLYSAYQEAFTKGELILSLNCKFFQFFNGLLFKIILPILVISDTFKELHDIIVLTNFLRLIHDILSSKLKKVIFGIMFEQIFNFINIIEINFLPIFSFYKILFHWLKVQ